MWLIKSKKVILTLTAMVLITVGTLAIEDIDRLRWYAGMIGCLVGCYNIGQGVADGISKGSTSTQTS